MCERARTHGPPDARSGPSVFVHGPDVLVDTPEESRVQLAFSGIRTVAAALYSHWHPDHTAGRRVWEAGYDFRRWPPEEKQTRCTPLYLPEQVALDFEAYLGIAAHLEFLQQRLGVVRVHVVPDGEAVELGGTRITPIRLAQDYVYAFLFEEADRRVLILMDELKEWMPPDLGDLDLAYLPLGIFEHHPFTGERAIDAGHPILRVEATYPETLEVVRALDARRIVLSHVEHMDGLSHDDVVRLGTRDGWEAAYDGMIVEVS